MGGAGGAGPTAGVPGAARGGLGGGSRLSPEALAKMNPFKPDSTNPQAARTIQRLDAVFAALKAKAES